MGPQQLALLRTLLFLFAETHDDPMSCIPLLNSVIKAADQADYW